MNTKTTGRLAGLIVTGAALMAMAGEDKTSSVVIPIEPKAELKEQWGVGKKAKKLDVPGLIWEFADHSRMLCPVGVDTGGQSLYMAPPGSDSPSGPTRCDITVQLRDILQITTPDGRQVKCEGDTVNMQHPSRCEIK